jgi:dual specificity protein kinase YAK1
MNPTPDADRHHVVKLLDHFEHRGHPCLIFEILSYNLYELLKNTKFRGVSLDLIHKFGKQILESLVCMGEHKIIHCDLKCVSNWLG